jgi:hypothetical protein
VEGGRPGDAVPGRDRRSAARPTGEDPASARCSSPTWPRPNVTGSSSWPSNSIRPSQRSPGRSDRREKTASRPAPSDTSGRKRERPGEGCRAERVLGPRCHRSALPTRDAASGWGQDA